MKLPRQPQIVTVTVSSPHDGDCYDAKLLLENYLENRFDYTQCWKADDGSYTIMCYPRAVND